jgi:hypothetical protein
LGSIPGSASLGLVFARRERVSRLLLPHIHHQRRVTYALAATLVEGAHCGVELVNRERHGGQQRGGKSSQSASVVWLYPEELVYSVGQRAGVVYARCRVAGVEARRLRTVKRYAKEIVGHSAAARRCGHL